MNRHTAIFRPLLRALLATALGITALPAAADSAQLQALRQQLRQAEQQDMPELAASLRQLVTMLEDDEAEAAAEGDAPPAATVRSSYFAEVGRDNLETCDYARDVQFDTICTAAMLRYQDYLTAMTNGSSTSTQEEAWDRHEKTAKVYLQGISRAGHGVDPGAPALSGRASTATESRDRAAAAQREAAARGAQYSAPVDSTRNRPAPCANKGCVTPR